MSAALDRTSDVYLRASRFIVLAVTIGMFAVMVAANSLEIAGRFFFGASFSWVQEISILAAMWVYFFGYALIAKDDEYIRVDIISRFVPGTVSRGLDIFARCSVVAFHVVVLWFGVETFRFLNLFTTSVLDWPESLFVLPIALGSADILLTETIRLRRLLSGAIPAGHRSLDAE
jgi:TRAP-type C4-dicarboxylate transport system permease small subunit